MEEPGELESVLPDHSHSKFSFFFCSVLFRGGSFYARGTERDAIPTSGEVSHDDRFQGKPLILDVGLSLSGALWCQRREKERALLPELRNLAPQKAALGVLAKPIGFSFLFGAVEIFTHPVLRLVSGRDLLEPRRGGHSSESAVTRALEAFSPKLRATGREIRGWKIRGSGAGQKWIQ